MDKFHYILIGIIILIIIAVIAYFSMTAVEPNEGNGASGGTSDTGLSQEALDVFENPDPSAGQPPSIPTE